MKTKKIVADSIPLALKMVRQQLGDNAIIVNTRAIKSGGLFGFFAKQKYEVTAYSMEKGTAQTDKTPSLEVTDKEAQENLNSRQRAKDQEEEELDFPIEQKTKMIEHMLKKRNHLHVYGEDGPPYRMSDLKNNVMGEENQDGKESIGGSVFHKKPQMLYQYYSQTAEQEKTAAPSTKSTQSEAQLLDEMKSLRNMMMVFMSGEQKGNPSSIRLSKWVNRLKRQGVDEAVIEAIISSTIDSLKTKFESLEDAADDAIEQEIILIVQGMLERKIPKSTVLPEDIRMINIIGPTGVGKTTSIAKLATEQILKQKRRVAMITTDVYRIAAVEQLKTYAGILNVPIEVARTREELDQAMMKLKHFDLIYMDTTGRNFKDEKNRESVREFLTHPFKSDNYLALSLTTKYEDLKLILEEFLDSPVKKLILTKFDETSSYGSILNIAYHFPYEMVYLTNGQSVPEDITSIDAAMLAHSIAGAEL